MRINGSERPTLTLVGGGKVENGSASTTYGCERVNGIISHRIQLRALSGLLNDLESGIDDLESRYLKVLDTSLIDILRLAERCLSIQREATTRI